MMDRSVKDEDEDENSLEMCMSFKHRISDLPDYKYRRGAAEARDPLGVTSSLPISEVPESGVAVAHADSCTKACGHVLYATEFSRRPRYIGDPNIFESYWRKRSEKCSLVISSSQFLSYVSDSKNICWYMEPELENEIKRLHRVVGNASVDGYHVVVGNCSTQLLHAALYALCSPDDFNPVNVVSAVPYYSNYPELTNLLRSGLYKWGGDARTYNKDGSYIEFVTSPNNPDGTIREAIVKKGQGKLVHDLAYYWPQYTPITSTLGYDTMLFTFSKYTGHARSQIGWVLVKDEVVAKKMIEFISINTIGVSKESQIRAVKILDHVSESCLNPGQDNSSLPISEAPQSGVAVVHADSCTKAY